MLGGKVYLPIRSTLHNTVERVFMWAKLYLCKLLWLLRLGRRRFSWVSVESTAWTPGRIQEKWHFTEGRQAKQQEVGQWLRRKDSATGFSCKRQKWSFLIFRFKDFIFCIVYSFHFVQVSVKFDCMLQPGVSCALRELRKEPYCPHSCTAVQRSLC